MMNESNQMNDHASGAANEQGKTATQEQLNRVAQALNTAAQAVRAGVGDARTSAEAMAANTSQAASKVVYATCYYLSYGVVFPTVLVASYIPTNNPIAHGLIDGAHAAAEAVRKARAPKDPKDEPVEAIFQGAPA
jgi:hypothetical protein